MRGDFALDIMHDGPRRAVGAVWDGGQAAAREFRVSMSTLAVPAIWPESDEFPYLDGNHDLLIK